MYSSDISVFSLNEKVLNKKYKENGGWAFETNVTGLGLWCVNLVGETIINAGYGFPMSVHTSISNMKRNVYMKRQCENRGLDP